MTGQCAFFKTVGVQAKDDFTAMLNVFKDKDLTGGLSLLDLIANVADVETAALPSEMYLRASNVVVTSYKTDLSFCAICVADVGKMQLLYSKLEAFFKKESQLELDNLISKGHARLIAEKKLRLTAEKLQLMNADKLLLAFIAEQVETKEPLKALIAKMYLIQQRVQNGFLKQNLLDDLKELAKASYHILTTAQQINLLQFLMAVMACHVKQLNVIVELVLKKRKDLEVRFDSNEAKLKNRSANNFVLKTLPRYFKIIAELQLQFGLSEFLPQFVLLRAQLIKMQVLYLGFQHKLNGQISKAFAYAEKEILKCAIASLIDLEGDLEDNLALKDMLVGYVESDEILHLPRVDSGEEGEPKLIEEALSVGKLITKTKAPFQLCTLM